MNFRVLGLGMFLSVSISVTGRAGAQTAADLTNATEPAAGSDPVPVPAEPAAPPAPPPAPVPSPQAPTPKSHAPSVQRGSDWQDSFAFGVQLGDYNPSGLTARVGGRAIALQVTAGFLPVLFVHYQDGDTRDGKLKFLLPFEVTPQLVIHAVTFRNEIRGNALLGYRYDSVLGHGATLGGQIEKRVSRHWLLEGMFGISYYPRAEDRLLGDQVPKNDTFAFPSPQFGSGITIGALFYP